MDEEDGQAGCGTERGAAPDTGDDSGATGRERTDRRSRRAFLRATGVSLAALTAGCPSATTTDSPASSRSPTPTRVPGPGPGPGGNGTAGPTRSPNGATGRSPTPTGTEPPATADPALYVAPNGRPSNPGTRAAPLGSLSTALDRADPGTTVRLRGGRYRHERTVGARGLSAPADAPVVVAAEPGERPVFDFSAASVGGLRFSDCRGLELRGFAVENAPSRGLFVEENSSDVLVADVRVDGSGGDPDASGVGVFVLDSERVTLRRVSSQNNYDPSTGGSNADGIAVERSPGAVVEGCVARGNSDDGVDLWQTAGATVCDCWAFDNGYGPEGRSAGDGDGFKLAGGTRSGNNYVERCVAFDNRERGFDDNGATRPLTLYHCTAWRNPVDYRLGCHIDGTDTACPPHRLRNNLSAGGAVRLSPFVDSAANSWELGIDDPAFASTDRSSPDFLRLAADSPAVDAGVDIGLSYHGEAPDLGAFEYRPSGTPTRTPSGSGG
jgi:hypothetical protein